MDSGREDGKADKKSLRIKKKYSKEKLEKLKASYEKRGIVYISRIPPHMASNVSILLACRILCRIHKALAGKRPRAYSAAAQSRS